MIVFCSISIEQQRMENGGDAERELSGIIFINGMFKAQP
jgi:hypothetical protein